MQQEKYIFNDDSLQNDILDVVAIEHAMLRSASPLPDLDEELRRVMTDPAGNPLTGEDTAKHPSDTNRRQTIRMVASAVLGAAAMLLAVLAMPWVRDTMRHDDTKTQAAQERLTADGMAAIHTSKGETVTVCLSDGTEVRLNANSSLEYPHRFTGNDRLVRLSGEAYFKVSHDKRHPFIVDAGGLLTKVLGTEFNVNARSAGSCRVTLVEGRVLVIPKRKGAQPVTLSPGEQFVMSGTEEASVSEVDTQETVAWTNNIIYYHDRPVSYILSDIAARYGIRVSGSNPSLDDVRADFSIPMGSALGDIVVQLNGLGIGQVVVKDGVLAVE